MMKFVLNELYCRLPVRSLSILYFVSCCIAATIALSWYYLPYTYLHRQRLLAHQTLHELYTQQGNLATLTQDNEQLSRTLSARHTPRYASSKTAADKEFQQLVMQCIAQATAKNVYVSSYIPEKIQELAQTYEKQITVTMTGPMQAIFELFSLLSSSVVTFSYTSLQISSNQSETYTVRAILCLTTPRALSVPA